MRLTIGLVSLTVLVAGCSLPTARSEPVVDRAAVPVPAPSVPSSPTREPTGVAAALAPSGGCDALLDYFVTQALQQVGPWGLGGGMGGEWMAEAPTWVDSAGEEGGEPARASGEPSSTNVQVEGVDEGDIVKAAGDRLYVLGGGQLRVFSTAGGGLEALGSLRLSEGFGIRYMLLHEDRLAIVGDGFADHPVGVELDAIGPIPFGSSLTEIVLVDVSDPRRPIVDDRLAVDGFAVATRLVEGRLRLVLEAHPVGLEWVHPEGSGLRAEREATVRNREVIRRSTIENWLPYYVTASGQEGTLLDCDDVLLPPEPSGLGTLSILDFDLQSGIDDWRAASVVASGSTVYANTQRTYVATQRWIDPVASDDQLDGHVTRIHRFDTPVDGPLAYVASGKVDGFLLNQFAMDEHDDHLRVASTTAPAWWGGGEADSESQVSVLATAGDRLVEVGRVDGLGVTETIRAVRFMGPVGYVVTFRQVDPLYVIDLSDPTSPLPAGELKIPGFSSYLHPVGDGLLVGVGQDADEETGATLGLQVSLFDVSDPAAPVRVDTFAPPVGDADHMEVWSPVQGDHKAFTVAGDRAYVPFTGWSWIESRRTEQTQVGLIEVDWSGGSLDASRVIQLSSGKGEWEMSSERVVVKGDVAYAVGHGGILVVDLPAGQVVDQVRF